MAEAVNVRARCPLRGQARRGRGWAKVCSAGHRPAAAVEGEPFVDVAGRSGVDIDFTITPPPTITAERIDFRFRLDHGEDVGHAGHPLSDPALAEDEGPALFGEVEDFVVLRGQKPVWAFRGTAEGGEIVAVIAGSSASCTISIATAAGESAEQVVQRLATAILDSGCLAQQGVTARVIGSTLWLQGPDVSLLDTLLGDPGFLHHVSVPGLDTAGLVVLVAVLMIVLSWAFGRRRGVLRS